MEQIRIESELEKQHQVGQGQRGDQHRDSGVGGDIGAAGQNGHHQPGEHHQQQQQHQSRGQRYNSGQDQSNLKRSAINNSLLDLSDNHSVLGYTMGGVATRRGSVGSLGEIDNISELLYLTYLFYR